MSAQLKKLEGLKRELTISVSADDMIKTYEKKIQNASQQARIKGFRPGKTPKSVIEQQYGKGILQEAAAELIDSTFQKEMENQKIKLAGRPNVDFDLEKLTKNSAFDYVAQFEIYPEITLTELADAEIESASGEVTEEDVAAMLIKLRTQHAEWVAADRAAKLGDRVKIDFDGEMDGKPLEQGSAKDHRLELGSKSMIPGFEDGIIGMKKNDTKTISISFPADYHVENLKGKPVQFAVTLHEIEEPKLPALDDAFAQKIGVKDGLEALKKQAREKMQAELNDLAQAQLKQAVLNTLLSRNNIDVPAALIDAEITHLQNMTRQQIAQYRRDLSESDIKKFPLAREPYLEDAKKRVTLGLLLAEVIKAHDIKVDQDKVRDRLKIMASQYGDVDQILPIIMQNKNMVADVEAFVLEEQAVEKLLTKARVLSVKKSYDAIVNAKS